MILGLILEDLGTVDLVSQRERELAKSLVRWPKDDRSLSLSLCFDGRFSKDWSGLFGWKNILTGDIESCLRVLFL